MFKYIKDFILGIKIIKKDEAIQAFQTSLDLLDADGDGYISVKELIQTFKRCIR